VKYIVLTYVPEEAWAASEARVREFPDEVYGPTTQLAEELIASGEFVYAVGLADPTLTQTVEIRDGTAIVTDGPYTQAKEILAGFGIVDVASHDRAMEVAAKSAAVFGRVEMRPLGEVVDGDDGL
jgi:hypothetical protein